MAQQPPDLILLDIMMPGMDGYQVAAKIKGNLATKNIPIIMVTALNDRDARMRGLSAGAEDFLTKPVDRAELCVRVRNLLRLKAYGDYHDKYSQMLEGEVARARPTWSNAPRTLEQQAAVLSRTGGVARSGAGRHRRARHARPDLVLESRRRGDVRLAQQRGARTESPG